MDYIYLQEIYRSDELRAVLAYQAEEGKPL